MANRGQFRTFLPYLRGIDPIALRIGSLYLNPLNPDDGLEDKRFEFQEDVEQDAYESNIKSFCWPEQKDDRGVKLDFAISRETAAGFHFSELLHLESDTSTKVSAVLEGDAGRRIKLRKPQKFLQEKVLSQPGCEEWIRTQASISFKSKFGRYKWNAPQIYMVTGVQLVRGGDVYATGTSDKKFEAGAGVDPSLAAGLPPGTLKFKIDGSHERSDEANNGYGYDDERIWAAQFMEIELEYGGEDDPALQKKQRSEKELPKTIADLRLKDVADLKTRGIRGLRNEGEKTPKPQARIVIDENEGTSDNEAPIRLDEVPYVHAVRDVSWEDYNEHKRYLDDEANPSPIE